MIRFRHKGNFARTERFFHRARRASFFSSLEELAQAGVDALSRATPVDSGLTAQSWDYEIRNEQGKVSIFWKNSNQNQGVPIAVIIQYGHEPATADMWRAWTTSIQRSSLYLSRLPARFGRR